MLLYEIKVNYQRQTGEDNPGGVRETYLVEGLNCSDVENRLMEHIKSLIFGDCEVTSCKKVQYFDIFPDAEADMWYKGRVELITVEDSGKETRKTVSILVQAPAVADAVKRLADNLSALDCEIVSVAKSPVMELYRAVD